METATTYLQVGLQAVNELSYLYRPEKLGDKIDPSLVQIRFSNKIRALDVEHDFISLAFGVKYMYNYDEILQCVYAFDFKVMDLKKYVFFDEDNSATFTNIVPIMFDVAVGTMRGLILAKTYGTPLYNFLIPIIDPIDLADGMVDSKPDAAN